MLILSSVMEIRRLFFRYYNLYYVRIVLETIYHRW